MAEFTFYGSLADRHAILSAILSFEGAFLLRDRTYSSPVIVPIRDASEALSPDAAPFTTQFFVGAPAFSHLPAECFLHTPKSGAPYYGIRHDAGGPLLQIMLPGSFERNGIPYLNPGNWSRPREYWRFYPDGRALEPIKPSDAVKAGYEQMKKLLASALGRVRVNRTVNRVGHDAIRSINENAARIKVYGKWYRRDASSAEMVPTGEPRDP